MKKEKKRAEQPATPEGASWSAIVGIGASAGGLAAFDAFFSALPVNERTGLVYVVIQHLAPDYKSMLTDLIKRYTPMQVLEVEDGMDVHSDCVYIIPPNCDMALQHGRLRLLEPSEPRGQRLPIDFFLRSLAEDQRERAIGIILSGTGSDGMLGVRAIKGEGGMVMAQNLPSTEYDGMPRSAIDTGLVDYILPPAEMPAHLLAYVQQAFGKTRRNHSHEHPVREPAALKKIFRLLRAQTGHDFSDYKYSTVVRRVERRMAVQQIAVMQEYAAFLEQNSGEIEALFCDLLIGVTRFFRDAEAFRAIEQLIVPQIFEGRKPERWVRVWVPACSTGEEAYSLAILLQERMEALRQNFKLQVFATDIDPRAIETARSGIYPESIAADVSPERLGRFFVHDADAKSYRIHKTIRDLMVFSEQDVTRDPPFSKLDLISCRNVLIYMSAGLHQKLIPLFHYALKPGAFLFLGSAETIGEFSSLFAPVDRKEKIYQRSDDLQAERALFGKFLAPWSEGPLSRREGKILSPATGDLRELAERGMLQEYGASGALINESGEILYLHGRTGKYLEPAQGEASLNVLKMAREGLRRPLTLALHHALNSGEVQRQRNLLVRTNGIFSTIDLTLKPLGGDTSHPRMFLIILEETVRREPISTLATPSVALASLDFTQPSLEGTFTEVPSGLEGNDLEAFVAVLKHQLRDKEEYLQATNEELETSNEELKSSNEEMQSVNEELQSTNEELETSKEELQSVNEELSTVNAELQSKVADLSRANNDMNNLLAGTGVGTVFVDHHLVIQRFTPSVTQVINLIPTDVGRPVAHIVSNLVGDVDLVEDVKQVLDTLVSREREVKTRGDSWFLLRIRPYRTLENIIEGAVITFVDITEMKKARDALSARELWLRQLADSLPLLVWTCRQDGTCDYLSPQWVKYTGVAESEQVGLGWLKQLHPEDRNQALERWDQALQDRKGFELEFRLRSSDNLYRWFSTKAVPLLDEGGQPTRWFITSSDIESLKRSDQALLNSQAELRGLTSAPSSPEAS